MNLRPRIEAALAATADRLTPGSGPEAVRHAANDFATIDASSENLNRRYADEEVRIATPAVFETKHPDGDPVTIVKKRGGLVVVFADSFIFVRRMGLGAREVKAVAKADVTVERVTAVLDGVEVPGLRIVGRGGKPRFTMAIAQSASGGSTVAQADVRDEIYALLTG